MEQDGSRSTRQRREYTSGRWLHPGQGEALLELYQDGRVVYEKDGVRTEKQGQWQKYYTVPGANVMEVTFHHRGTDEVASLRQHLLYEVCPGVWRAQDDKQLFIVEEEFDGTAGLWREGYDRMQVPPELKPVAKHSFCWLHPGRRPAILVLTHAQEVIYVDRYTDPEKALNKANGHYAYGANDAGEDEWFTHFHCTGEGNKVTTRLRRCCSVSPIWRAFGDGTREDGTGHYGLAEWHIVMFQMD